MKVYVRNYIFRIHELVIVFFLPFVFLLLFSILFSHRFNSLSDALNTYEECPYQYIYVLNYKVDMDDVFLFPDTGVQAYLSDGNDTKRVKVSVLMIDEGINYSVVDMNNIVKMTAQGVVVSQNTAEEYNLSVGDNIYLNYGYDNERKQLSIAGIIPAQYDYTNPIIDNNIGVIYLPYDNAFSENIACKYICFSENSKADNLSEYPQVISRIIGIDDNYIMIFKQGVYILLFEILFMILYLFAYDRMVLVKTNHILERVILKGMSVNKSVFVNCIEILALCVMPTFIMLLLGLKRFHFNSFISILFYALPICICVLYFIIEVAYIYIKRNTR